MDFSEGIKFGCSRRIWCLEQLLSLVMSSMWLLRLNSGLRRDTFVSVSFTMGLSKGLFVTDSSQQLAFRGYSRSIAAQVEGKPEPK